MKKFEKIVTWIQEEVRSGRMVSGEKLPSEQELSEQFQVSRQTVRRALEELVKENIVESRRGSGSYICEDAGILLGNTERRADHEEKRIAVMLTYIDTYIFPIIVREIEKKVTQAGGILQIAMTDNSVAKERMHLEEFLRTRRIDGLIAEPVKSGLPNPNLDLYQKLQKSGIPVVFVNSFYENLTIPHVSLDDEKAGYLATKHLLECGHTRIAGIFKADDGQGRMRYAGYTKALMEHSLKIKNRQILWVDSEDIREMEMESDRVLKRLDGCTACVCYNDEIASKLVKVLQSAEIKVPDQISVIGIDRESGHFVIKPSGVEYDKLTPEDMVVVDLNGNKVEGRYNPSSDTPTHVVLYNRFPKIGGVVHTHSAWATSWAQAGRDIPCYGTTHADYIYGEIPCVRNLTKEEIEEAYEKNTGVLIADEFEAKKKDYIAVPAVLCKNHGVFTWGKDAHEAVHNAVVAEEVAKMAARCEMINPQIKPAPQELQDKHYYRKHGANAYYGQNTAK